MLELKRNIYVSIFILLLGSLIGCSTNRPFVSQNESTEVFLEIYKQLTRHPYSMMYRLNRQICYNDSLTPYVYLHAEYEYYLSNGKEGYKSLSGSKNSLEIDFKRLIPHLRDTFYLPQNIIFTGRDQEVSTIVGTGYGDWAKIKNLNTYTFSPFIPTNQTDTYIIFVELENSSDNHYYFYQVRKINGTFVFGRLDYNDYVVPLMYNREVDLLQEEYDRRYGKDEKKE